MKCLLITSYFPPTIGGSAKVYGNLCKYGKKQISILSARCDQDSGTFIQRDRDNSDNFYSVKYLQSPNIHCRNTFQSIWVLLRHDVPTQANVLFKTLSLIRRNKFDVICIGDLQMQGWMTLIIRLITKSKVVLFIHGEELSTVTTSRFFGKNAKLYLDKSDGIIAVSQFTKNMIIHDYDIAENKIQLISNGIDLEHYHPSSQTNEIIKEYISPEEILIFGIGRLIERKGFDKAIEAISIVKEKGYKVRYVIAGVGKMHNRLRKIIESLDLASTVTLIGQLSHEKLTAFYQYCDVFLMPNRELENGDTEGFGLVFLEANAYKKPVIGGNYGGAIDAIKHNETGLLVESKSANEIANAIIELIDSDSVRKKLGENGYLWVKQNDVKIKVDEFLAYCNFIAAS